MLPKNIVKKYKNVIKDKQKNITYVIYSDKKMGRKQMLRQVRYYHLNPHNPIPDYDSKVNIIVDEC